MVVTERGAEGAAEAEAPNDWDGSWKRLFEEFPLEALEGVCGLQITGAKVMDLPTERQRPMWPDRVLQVTWPDSREEMVHLEIQVQPAGAVGPVVEPGAGRAGGDGRRADRGDRVAVLIRDALERKKMGNVLEGTELGNALIARGEALGEARGRVSGRAELLRAVLVERFGEVDGVDEVAASLAGSGDAAAVVKRIHAAAGLQDLVG